MYIHRSSATGKNINRTCQRAFGNQFGSGLFLLFIFFFFGEDASTVRARATAAVASPGGTQSAP